MVEDWLEGILGKLSKFNVVDSGGLSLCRPHEKKIQSNIETPLSFKTAVPRRKTTGRRRTERRLRKTAAAAMSCIQGSLWSENTQSYQRKRIRAAADKAV
ncbi:hypothetical protein BM221_005114 [Beauveria bassiana]|uniref:Uncharacterized protein n=1 Tax=Beauveria bassiana TaxID=176275 RepID=A0A2N6NMM5_BEABA|nr:hypothetical protein BM221_005114 [Beauveria bassiana]